jgi:hypothetical protein
MAFGDYAKCEGFTLFSGAESNVHTSFGKFRRLLFFFLTSVSPEMAKLLDEHAEGPFDAEANVLLFHLLDRFTTGAAKCMLPKSAGCDGAYQSVHAD